VNHQSQRRAFEVGERHYDLGNDLYEAMLDKRMTYTCAYWKSADCVDDAQEAKLDLVCRKIGLQPGDKVLDVGCGWGSFARFAAERYGAEVVGITISKEQAELTSERCKGLPVEIRLQDYRDCHDAAGKFDRVVSLGMMEHVGYRNYRTYMSMIYDNLRPNGLALIQVIGTMKSAHTTDPWLDRYIFPNSMLPSVKQFGEAIDGLFMMQDWHSFGHYYDLTLMAWYSNFEKAWGRLSASYDERFRRMWRYYLLFCAGIFRSGKAQLWQVVMSKGRVPGVYEAVR
jgi:cyclopropane-fatty-acyl-phospholipid synthase